MSAVQIIKLPTGEEAVMMRHDLVAEAYENLQTT